MFRAMAEIIKNPFNAKSILYKYIISIGLKGMSDLYGIIKNDAGYGVFVAIEVKTGKAVMTTEQKNYKAMVEMLGGIHILARDEKEVVQILHKRVAM